jgi:hypothetical protein
MKPSAALRPLALALVLATTIPGLALAAETPAAQPAARDFKTPVLNKAQIDALLAKPDQIVVIDVRRPDELQSKGSFPVFLSIHSA